MASCHRSSFPVLVTETVVIGGDKEVEILNVLRELLGEAIHIITLNASSLGALLSTFIERLKSRRKKKR